jgi:hypothetical protein
VAPLQLFVVPLFFEASGETKTREVPVNLPDGSQVLVSKWIEEGILKTLQMPSYFGKLWNITIAGDRLRVPPARQTIPNRLFLHPLVQALGHIHRDHSRSNSAAHLLELYDLPRTQEKINLVTLAAFFYASLNCISFIQVGKNAICCVVDGWASRDAAWQAGGLGSIPGPGQTYV